jgi:glycosyltransferase involved in cell wall biosynthesis
MRRADSGRARLIYVLGQFPSLSETFILREMVALEEMGFTILPLSMQAPPSDPAHAQAEPFLRRTLYRPRPLSGATFGALVRTLFQRPLGLASGFCFLARMLVMHPGCARELLSAFAAALYFASNLSPREARHVHAHFASYPATVGLMLMEICGCGYSISCHAQDIFGPGTILPSRKFREADFVTVCTRHGMERLQRNHSLILADKLHLIHHGVDTGRMLQETHVDYPLPMILSVGRLVEKKGFPFLLQAAALLNGRGLPFELVIAGDGPMRDELERLAGGLGLRDKVVFAGHLTQEQLAHVYRRADAFCLASTVAKDGDRDGLPNVILEAMAYGVPVVASALSAIPEAVHDDETGLLAQPGSPQSVAEQLERALSDEALRGRLIANARQLVAEEYDLAKNTVRLGRLFAQNLGLRNWPPTNALPEPPATPDES